MSNFFKQGFFHRTKTKTPFELLWAFWNYQEATSINKTEQVEVDFRSSISICNTKTKFN